MMAGTGVSSVSRTKTNDEPSSDDAYNFSEMTVSQMVIRQLSIFRLRKNVDPTWKAKAIQSVHPPILFAYAISSFAFAPAGTLVLIHFDSLEDAVDEAKWFPWIPFGVYLWLQSVVTTFSDVIYVHKPSIWHPVDRIFAWCGVVFVVLFYVALLSDGGVREDHTAGLVITLICQGLSIASFIREWYVKASGNIEWVVIYHTCWHFFAPAGFTSLLISLLVQS